MADPNVQALQSMPKWGKFLFDAFSNMQKQLRNVSIQTNTSLAGSQNEAPPQINAVHVTAGGGVAHVQITDNNTLYRGVHYFVDVSPDAGFSAPVTFHMGASRDIRVPVGSEPLHYRAYSGYPTSPPSAPVYHGGAAPVPIAATGTAFPVIPSGQGSGTGFPGQISGYGPVQWRGTTPPRRV